MPHGMEGGLAFLVSVQPNPFSVKIDDLPIDALDLGMIGCSTKQRPDFIDAFVDFYAGLAHGGRSPLRHALAVQSH